MQNRSKHKIKNHKLDFKDIRKKANKDNNIFSLMLIAVSSIPSLFFMGLLYKAWEEGYVYALIRFKGIQKIYWDKNPEAFILACFFLALTALALSSFPVTQISELRASMRKKRGTSSDKIKSSSHI